MRPNFIPGMKTRGHLRANKDEHFRKQAVEYLRQQAKELKERREKLQREKANLEYKY
jgi:hypothetical protein